MLHPDGPASPQDQAADRQLVGLRPRPGEHDLVRRRPDQGGNLLFRLGADLSQMLGLAGVLTAGLGTTASAVARALVERIWRPLADGENSDQLPAFLARGRVLLGQAVASILADRLAAALYELSGDITGGEELRAVIDRIRVGAVTDSAGTVHRRDI